MKVATINFYMNNNNRAIKMFLFFVFYNHTEVNLILSQLNIYNEDIFGNIGHIDYLY